MRTRTTTLIALCALAGATQALAPGSAAAMDNGGGVAVACRMLPPSLRPELCSKDPANDSAGGSVGGNTGSMVGEETIIINDAYTEPACSTGSNCLPSQTGGRRDPASDDDDAPGEPRRGGGGGLRARSKAKAQLTRCRYMFAEIDDLLHRQDIKEEWAKIEREVQEETTDLDAAYVADIARAYNREQQLEARFNKQKCRDVLSQASLVD